MELREFFIYLFIMAGSTYLIRAVPFALIRKKITNPFIKSFLYYIPYTVLAAMTFPSALYATGGNVLAAAIGLAAARTGGLASSYAVSAGAQAYGGYMEKLEEAARALYDSERAEKADKLGVAQGVSSQVRDTARESIDMALAAGKTIEEISDLHPEWISDSGYDTDYWNYYATAAKANGGNSVEPADMTIDQIKAYVAEGNYPTAAMAAAYRDITGGAELEGYYGDEYAETYNYIKKNKDDSDAVYNYIEQIATDENIDTLYSIAKDQGIDLDEISKARTIRTTEDIDKLLEGAGMSSADLQFPSEDEYEKNEEGYKTAYAKIIGNFDTYQELINAIYNWIEGELEKEE